MQSVVIETPDAQPVQRELIPLAERAKMIVVSNRDQHGEAQEYLAELAQLERRVIGLFQGPKTSAYVAHRDICATEKQLLTPIQDARRIVTRAITHYETEERRRAEEERRRKEEEARRREEERLLAEAAAAEASGDTDLAEQIIQEVETTPAPVIKAEPELAQVAGVVSQERWHAEVTDFSALVAYVASNPTFLNALEPNMTTLNALARSMRGNMRIPGVRAVSEIVKSVRAV